MGSVLNHLRWDSGVDGPREEGAVCEGHGTEDGAFGDVYAGIDYRIGSDVGEAMDCDGGTGDVGQFIGVDGADEVVAREIVHCTVDGGTWGYAGVVLKGYSHRAVKGGVGRDVDVGAKFDVPGENAEVVNAHVVAYLNV